MKDVTDPFKGATMINHKNSSNHSSKGPAHSGKIKSIILEAAPVLLMIALIPFIKNDVNLSGIYLAIILTSLLIKYEKNDFIIAVFGFFIMIFFEFIFVSTGVETFQRNSLFGIMPIWLPLIWAYGFIAIKRCSRILEE